MNKAERIDLLRLLIADRETSCHFWQKHVERTKEILASEEETLKSALFKLHAARAELAALEGKKGGAP